MNTAVIDRPTEQSPVPNGGNGAGFFDWLGKKLFVPDNVVDSWKANDEAIRERTAVMSSSKEVQARIASDSAMAKSAENIRIYESAPFVPVLDGVEVMDAITTSAAEAPKTLANYTANNILAPAAGAVNKTVMSLIPWPVWVIVGLALVLGVGVFAYAKGKT